MTLNQNRARAHVDIARRNPLSEGRETCSRVRGPWRVARASGRRWLCCGAIGGVLAICFAPLAGQAVEQAQVTGCLGQADLKVRLACYDGLVPAQGALSVPADDHGDYVLVTLVELKANKNKLLGDGVTTSGRLYVQGQLAFLREQGMDATPVPVSISRLPKEDQREVRTRCPSSLSACNVLVEGKVVHVSLGIGIAIEDVTFR